MSTAAERSAIDSLARFVLSLFHAENKNESEMACWAGLGFVPLYPHDGRLFHAPGLYAFVACDPAGRRKLLWADHCNCIARSARIGHPQWRAALALGFNELHLHLCGGERIDRRQLLDRLVRRERPTLLVEPRGVEPLTSSLRTRRSTN